MCLSSSTSLLPLALLISVQVSLAQPPARRQPCAVFSDRPSAASEPQLRSPYTTIVSACLGVLVATCLHTDDPAYTCIFGPGKIATGTYYGCSLAAMVRGTDAAVQHRPHCHLLCLTAAAALVARYHLAN